MRFEFQALPPKSDHPSYVASHCHTRFQPTTIFWSFCFSIITFPAASDNKNVDICVGEPQNVHLILIHQCAKATVFQQLAAKIN